MAKGIMAKGIMAKGTIFKDYGGMNRQDSSGTTECHKGSGGMGSQLAYRGL